MDMTLLRKVRRHLRWLLGRGQVASDFDYYYSRAGKDAFDYTDSDFHEKRFALVLAEIPPGRFSKALEVGCAEGLLTRRLAPRVDRLIACDFHPVALQRAKESCKDVSNVEFRLIDIRRDDLSDTFDLIVYSDVLECFSKRELDAVIGRARALLRSGGHVVFANHEWQGHRRGLSSPRFIMSRFRGCGEFMPVMEAHHYIKSPNNIGVAIGVYRRR